MKAFNKRRKPKHAMKIGHNENRLFERGWLGWAFSTKRIGETLESAYGSTRHNSYKFNFKKQRSIIK